MLEIAKGLVIKLKILCNDKKVVWCFCWSFLGFSKTWNGFWYILRPFQHLWMKALIIYKLNWLIRNQVMTWKESLTKTILWAFKKNMFEGSIWTLPNTPRRSFHFLEEPIVMAGTRIALVARICAKKWPERWSNDYAFVLEATELRWFRFFLVKLRNSLAAVTFWDLELEWLWIVTGWNYKDLVTLRSDAINVVNGFVKFYCIGSWKEFYVWESIIVVLI